MLEDTIDDEPTQDLTQPSASISKKYNRDKTKAVALMCSSPHAVTLTLDTEQRASQIHPPPYGLLYLYQCQIACQFCSVSDAPGLEVCHGLLCLPATWYAFSLPRLAVCWAGLWNCLLMLCLCHPSPSVSTVTS